MFDLHNPCGVPRQANIEWHGQQPDQHHPELVAFRGPAWSVRATARQLLALGRHGRVVTPASLALAMGLGAITRLCAALNAGAEYGIDLNDVPTMRAAIRAIAAERTGATLDDATLDEGLIQARILEPKD
jgi:hypothetical protein